MGPSGADRTQVGPMMAPWTLLSGLSFQQVILTHLKSRWSIPERFAGIILWMHPANERWCYTVSSSLIGWVHTQNDPWLWVNISYEYTNNWWYNQKNVQASLVHILWNVLCAYICWNFSKRSFIKIMIMHFCCIYIYILIFEKTEFGLYFYWKEISYDIKYQLWVHC